MSRFDLDGVHDRLLIAGVVASLVAGVYSGLAGRLAMSVIAAGGGTSTQAAIGQLTLPGTLRIVIVPMIFGIPFVWLWLSIGRLWTRRPWAVRGLLYALGMLAIPGLLFMTDTEFDIPGANRDIGRLSFIPSFLIYGALAGLVGDRLLRRSRSIASDPAGSSTG